MLPDTLPIAVNNLTEVRELRDPCDAFRSMREDTRCGSTRWSVTVCDDDGKELTTVTVCESCDGRPLA